jgi:hypothetical protein
MTCGKAGCAGLTFGTPKCDGSDNDEEMHHCVHCGELVWEEKGAYCERCGDYWCQGGWQHTFVFPECDSAAKADEEMMCVKCFLAAPELWCADDKCDCKQKQSIVQTMYDKFLAAGETCASIELVNGKQDFIVEVKRFPQDETAANLWVVENGQETQKTFGGQQAVEDACGEAHRLAREKQQHGFLLKYGAYGHDGTYGYLSGFH